MIVDGQIGWLRKKKFFSLFELNFIDEDGTSGIMTGGSGTGAQLEVAALGIMGWLLAAGEFALGAFPIPQDLDPKHEVGVRINYTGLHDNTGNATVSWIYLFKMIREGIAFAAGATALDTPIPLLDPWSNSNGDITVTTDWLYQVTDRGIILPETLAIVKDDVEEQAMMSFSLEMDAVANLTSVVLLGITLDYVPWKCQGVGSEIDRPLVHTDIL